MYEHETYYLENPSKYSTRTWPIKLEGNFEKEWY